MMFRRLLRTTFSVAILAVAAAAATRAQGIGITNGFPYSSSPGDTTPSIYLPFTPFEVAGTHGFLRTDPSGNFAFEDGTPARFYGVTMQWAACYPDSVQAEVIAKRLRKIGVNLVRFQYFDNAYDFGDWAQQRTFLDAATQYTTLHSKQIERLDWFLYQLKRNGIYAALTLQSARAARASDGLGADADSAMWLGRELPYLYPQARAVTRRIIQLLLDHTNPFTGTAYKNEPAIAMFEGLDQGSLISMNRLGYTEYREGQGGFSYRHSRRLDTLFTQFLRTRYANNAALTAGWRTPPPGGGFPDLIKEGSFEGEFERYWTMQANNGASVTPVLSQDDSVPNGSVSMKLRVRNTRDTSQPYDAYMVENIDGLEFNTAYRLTFKAKSTVPHWKIRVLAYQAGGGYMGAGLDSWQYAEPYWKQFQADFLVPIKSSVPIALVLYFGSNDGEFSIDDVQLRKLDVIGLTAGESMDNYSVVRVPLATEAAAPTLSSKRVEDQSDFYIGLERDYFNSLHRFVRDTVGARQPFTGAAHYWASLFQERVVQGDADFTMSSQGWDYVSTNGSGQYEIRNYSPLRVGSYGGAFWTYAQSAHRRQPFVATYAQPYPNRYQAEGMMMLPAYSSLQEWDGVLLDAYADNVIPSGDGIDSAAFSLIAKNPVVTSVMPFASFIFRNQLIAPAQTTINLQHSAQIARIFPRMLNPWGYYSVPGGFNSRAPFVSKLVIDSVNASEFTQLDDIAFTEQVEGQVQSDTREILLEYSRGTISLDARRVQGTSGYLTRAGNITLRNVDVKLLSGNETATMIWTVLDSSTQLGTAGKSALALISRAEPTGWQWLDSMHWNMWGKGPMLFDPVRIRLTFKPSDNSNVAKLTPLDASGMPAGTPITATAKNGKIEATIDQSSTRALWYAVELSYDPSLGLDAAASGAAALVARPNIVADRSYIDYVLPVASADLRVEAFDALGRLVRVLHTGAAEAGRGTLRFDAEGLAAGAYIVRMRDGAGLNATTTVTVIR